GAARLDLFLHQPQDLLLVHPFGVPEACERVAAAALPVGVHRSGEPPPVAQDAAVPRASLDHASFEVRTELYEAVEGELAQLRAELGVGVGHPGTGEEREDPHSRASCVGCCCWRGTAGELARSVLCLPQERQELRRRTRCLAELLFFVMTGAAGLEPATCRLTAGRSAR